MTRSAVSPWIARGLYLFALTLVVYPLIDLTSTVWPLRFGDMAWRYGMLGLGAGYLHTPLLGLVLGMAVAFWDEHPGMVRFGATVSLVVAVALLIAMAVFAMDVMGMRAVRPEEARTGVLVGGILQEIKYFGATLVLACLALGGTHTAKRLASSAARQPSSPGVLKRD